MIDFIEFIEANWLTILSSAITVITLFRTHKRNQAISVHLSLLVDESNSFYKMIDELVDTACIKKWSASFNHSITCLLSIMPSSAKKWISVKPENEWPTWEQKLGVSMWKFRMKNKISNMLK